MLSLQSCSRVSEPWFALNKSIYDDILEVALSDIQSQAESSTHNCSELLKLLNDTEIQPGVSGSTTGHAAKSTPKKSDEVDKSRPVTDLNNAEVESRTTGHSQPLRQMFTVGASEIVSKLSPSSGKSRDRVSKVGQSSRSKRRLKARNSASTRLAFGALEQQSLSVAEPSNEATAGSPPILESRKSNDIYLSSESRASFKNNSVNDVKHNSDDSLENAKNIYRTHSDSNEAEKSDKDCSAEDETLEEKVDEQMQDEPFHSSASACNTAGDCCPLDLTLSNTNSTNTCKVPNTPKRTCRNLELSPQKENQAISPSKLNEPVDRVGWTKVEKETLLKVVERLSISFLADEYDKSNDAEDETKIHKSGIRSLKTFNEKQPIPLRDRLLAMKKSGNIRRFCDKTKSNSVNLSSSVQKLDAINSFYRRGRMAVSIKVPKASTVKPLQPQVVKNSNRANTRSKAEFQATSTKNGALATSALLSFRGAIRGDCGMKDGSGAEDGMNSEESSRFCQQFWAAVDKNMVSNMIEQILSSGASDIKVSVTPEQLDKNSTQSSNSANIRVARRSNSSIVSSVPGSDDKVGASELSDNDEQSKLDKSNDCSMNSERVNDCLTTLKWKSNILRRVHFDQISSSSRDDPTEEWRRRESISNPLAV